MRADSEVRAPAQQSGINISTAAININVWQTPHSTLRILTAWRQKLTYDRAGLMHHTTQCILHTVGSRGCLKQCYSAVICSCLKKILFIAFWLKQGLLVWRWIFQLIYVWNNYLIIHNHTKTQFDFIHDYEYFIIIIKYDFSSSSSLRSSLPCECEYFMVTFKE